MYISKHVATLVPMANMLLAYYLVSICKVLCILRKLLAGQHIIAMAAKAKKTEAHNYYYRMSLMEAIAWLASYWKHLAIDTPQDQQATRACSINVRLPNELSSVT